MNMAYTLGVIVGILVGVIFIVVFVKWTKIDGKVRCKWDERQLLIRGNGYKYAFFTVIILLILYVLLGESIVRFPMNYQATSFCIIVLGVAVDVVYCIWKGAYFSLNENRKRVLILFAVVGAFNMAIGIRNIMSGEALTDGVLNADSMNLFCGLLFVIIFLTLLFRMVIPDRELNEE